MSKHTVVFTMPIRVYFQDTDAGGVVYHTNYVNYMEHARTEWLRTFGYSNMGMMKELGIVFVVRSIQLDYLRPALLDDLLTVSAQAKDIGRSRITLYQTVMRGDEVLVEGEINLVCVTAQGFRPVPIPDTLRDQWKG